MITLWYNCFFPGIKFSYSVQNLSKEFNVVLVIHSRKSVVFVSLSSSLPLIERLTVHYKPR